MHVLNSEPLFLTLVTISKAEHNSWGSQNHVHGGTTHTLTHDSRGRDSNLYDQGVYNRNEKHTFLLITSYLPNLAATIGVSNLGVSYEDP